MIKLGGLWERRGKNGPFWAGKLGNANVMIFPNTRKRGEDDPDFEMFISEPQNKGYAQRGQNGPTEYAGKQNHQNDRKYQKPSGVKNYATQDPPKDEAPWPDEEPPF